ncbi:MAG TPA: hypothetical protein VIY48_14125 [Candidatus Paceibacterota bacterium]
MKAALAAVRTEYELTLRITGEEWHCIDAGLRAVRGNGIREHLEKASIDALVALRDAMDDAISDAIE